MKRQTWTWSRKRRPDMQFNHYTSNEETTCLIKSQLIDNEAFLRNKLEGCSDVKFRRLKALLGHALVMYIPNLTNQELLDRFVISPLLHIEDETRWMEVITEETVAVGFVEKTQHLDAVIDGVLQGKAAVFIDGCNTTLLIDVQQWEMRAIDEPPSEAVVRGPRDGFTETISVNIAMIRRRLKTPQLKFDSLTIGSLSKTSVCLAYMDGIVRDNVLEEVRKRLQSIKLDVVLDSHFIEEMIEDAPYSPYPQIQYTERPDVAVSCLTEGKVAIIVDNTPNVLLVPFTFWGGFQAAEDYYERFVYTSAVRVVRLLLLNVAIFMTPMYVAIVTFHPQLLPTPLLLNIATAREPSPFPTLIEALIMEFLFEGLREAGVRLPKAIGSAVSIVGGLVLGQAAVDAGLVSAPIVIMVATGGIASFAIPRYNFGFSYRLLRFPILIFGGSLGLFGIAMVFLFILAHQVNLTSVGVPYLSPVAPEEIKGFKDVFIRAPRWAYNDLSEQLTSGPNRRRIPKGQRPGKKKSGENP